MPYLYLVRHAQPDFAGHYDSVTELETTGRLQAADVRADDAECGKTIRQHPAPVGLLAPPPERFDAMFERDAAQGEASVAMDQLTPRRWVTVDRNVLLAR